MNTEDKSIELVQQLIRTTEEGHIAWRPTARIDEFTCSLESGFGILVGKNASGGYSLQMLDQDGRELLQVSDVRHFVHKPTSPLATPDLMPRLFDLARWSALHVDEAIDVALPELKRS